MVLNYFKTLTQMVGENGKSMTMYGEQLYLNGMKGIGLNGGSRNRFCRQNLKDHVGDTYVGYGFNGTIIDQDNDAEGHENCKEPTSRLTSLIWTGEIIAWIVLCVEVIRFLVNLYFYRKNKKTEDSTLNKVKLGNYNRWVDTGLSKQLDHPVNQNRGTRLLYAPLLMGMTLVLTYTTAVYERTGLLWWFMTFIYLSVLQADVTRILKSDQNDSVLYSFIQNGMVVATLVFFMQNREMYKIVSDKNDLGSYVNDSDFELDVEKRQVNVFGSVSIILTLFVSVAHFYYLYMWNKHGANSSDTENRNVKWYTMVYILLPWAYTLWLIWWCHKFALNDFTALSDITNDPKNLPGDNLDFFSFKYTLYLVNIIFVLVYWVYHLVGGWMMGNYIGSMDEAHENKNNDNKLSLGVSCKSA